MNFRHEWKHEINYADLMALRTRLRAVMQQDPYAIDGKYRVHSLYFDNLEDRALREKIDGVNGREKFRLRYYNGDTTTVQLEKKSKINGLCRKEKEKLSREEAWAAATGQEDLLGSSEKPLVQELYAKMRTQGLRPKTVVEYTREPFVFAPGNVRVTLDYSIRLGMSGMDFLDPGGVTIPAGMAPVVLEVKWDAYLPSVIRDIVQIPSTHTSAFSKYAACRMYG